MREPTTMEIILREIIDACAVWGARWSMQILLIGGIGVGIGLGIMWWVTGGGK